MKKNTRINNWRSDRTHDDDDNVLWIITKSGDNVATYPIGSFI